MKLRGILSIAWENILGEINSENRKMEKHAEFMKQKVGFVAHYFSLFIYSLSKEAYHGLCNILIYMSHEY